MKRFLFGTTCLATLGMASTVAAQDYYLGEILTVGANFCPAPMLSAEGQLLSISENSALFALYGTTYGGDGINTFALPDYRGRKGVGQGTGAGLSTFVLGQTGGAETSTMTSGTMPAHSHAARVRASNAAPDTNSPTGNSFATFPVGTNMYTTGNDNTPMSNNEVQIVPTGSSAAFNVRDPYLAMRFCVVTAGIFPPRN